MLRNRSALHGDRGQALILFVLAMTVILVIGVIVVDFSLWLTERRGAQKDADLATLAGAMELLQQDFVNPSNNDDAATRAAAEDAVYDWADYNDLPSADVHNVKVENRNCFGHSPVLDSVRLDAEHHGGPLFISIVDPLFSTKIGAPARACIGSVVTAKGLLPVGIQISGVDSDCWDDVNGDGSEDPLFGQECVLTFGAGDQTSGEAGNLRLYNNGSLNCSDNNTGGNQTYKNEIESGGANATCHVYKYFGDPSKTCANDPGGCVYPLTGVGSTPELTAFENLIASEGECDATFGDGDGVDQFLEGVEAVNGDTTPSPETVFAKRECTTPRLVSLIIIKNFSSQGNRALPIEAFAAFYIEGCTNDAGTQFSAKCRKKDFSGQIGQFRLQGFFVNILVSGGDTGQINKWSPKSVVLKD
jgi:hypothetical protein